MKVGEMKRVAITDPVLIETIQDHNHSREAILEMVRCQAKGLENMKRDMFEKIYAVHPEFREIKNVTVVDIEPGKFVLFGVAMPLPAEEPKPATETA